MEGIEASNNLINNNYFKKWQQTTTVQTFSGTD
jgi:hypothetical protein